MDLDRCSLNSMTLPKLDLQGLLAAAAAHRIGYVAPWRHLLEEPGLGAAARMIRDHGLELSSLCRGGMFTAADAAGRRAAIDDNRRAIDEAAALAAPMLVLVCGGVVEKDVTGSAAMVCDGIGEVLEHAEAAGVRLGIEPLHPMMASVRSVIARVDDAMAIVDKLGRPEHLGVVVDAYHVWWDIDLERQLLRAKGRIVGFHVSDWVSPLTGSLTAGRGMMGDGCIDLPRMATMVAASGYAGPIEVEIISDELGRLDADSLLGTVTERFRGSV